jgi:hypothetical protein
MNLYIQTENGQAINHPAFEDNLIQAFGEVPSHWEPFVRVERPALTEYQVFEDPNVTYEKVDGVWTDVFHIRDMTTEEKAIALQNKIDTAKAMWAALPDRDNFSAWTFNDETARYEPPIPRPTEGNYFWQGTTNSWVVRPARPDDGKIYKLDFASATWVEVTQ